MQLCLLKVSMAQHSTAQRSAPQRTLQLGKTVQHAQHGTAKFIDKQRSAAADPNLLLVHGFQLNTLLSNAF